MSRFDFNDTPEGGDPWKAANEWAIPAAPRQRSVIDTGQARQTFRVLRANYRRECMARRAPCWLCPGEEPIDYSIKSGPTAWECDHFIPVSVAPELALEPSNFRPSHSLCNRRRQARTDDEMSSQMGEPSEDW